MCIQIRTYALEYRSANHVHTTKKQDDTTYMVTCGTQHYQKNLADWGNASEPRSIYPALREYNSGSVDSSNLSEATGGGGNVYYVSDLAQRFQGWTD